MLRLEIYQETAHFRIPTIGMPYLSYPLPPPSTVFGFLRAITDYESINYQNTKLSIQGVYKGVSFEKEQLIQRKKTKKETGVIAIQKLHQCNWVIHIKSPFEEKIIDAIKKSHRILRLGRKEDMIIDINVEKVEEKEIGISKPITKIDKYNIKTYVNWEKDKSINGSLFKMALDTIVDENKNIIGYKSLNLIYTNINRVKSKVFDGEYFINLI